MQRVAFLDNLTEKFSMDVATPKKKTKGILSCQRLLKGQLGILRGNKANLTSKVRLRPTRERHRKLRSPERQRPLWTDLSPEHSHTVVGDHSLTDVFVYELVWQRQPRPHHQIERQKKFHVR